MHAASEKEGFGVLDPDDAEGDEELEAAIGGAGRDAVIFRTEGSNE